MLGRGIAALLLAIGAVSARGDSLADEARKHLPPDAVLAAAPIQTSVRPAPIEPAVASYLAAGVKTLAFVYIRSGTLTLRVVSEDRGDATTSDVPLVGSYVYNLGNAAAGLVLKDLAGIGRPQIAVATSYGASAGSYLNIFALERGSLVNLVDDLPIGGYQFDIDCKRTPSCRILSLGKWVDHASSTVAVFEAIGGKFLRTDNGATDYYDERVSKLRNAALAGGPLSVFGRVGLAQQVALEYSASHQYELAIQFCSAVLEILGDPARNAPRSVKLIATGKPPSLESDMREGAARLHEVMAEVYQASDQTQEANEQTARAQAIRRGETIK